MKITVKQLKEMIKQEFENVLLEGKKEETCPECKNAKGKCKCPKNEEKLEEKAQKCDELTACPAGHKCQDGECVSIMGSEKLPPKEVEVGKNLKEESIEEQIVAKVLEALQ